jgi:hypothetical protein
MRLLLVQKAPGGSLGEEHPKYECRGNDSFNGWIAGAESKELPAELKSWECWLVNL